MLNKVDLSPPPLVAAWRKYFQELFPGLRVVYFTSFSREQSDSSVDNSLQKRRRKGPQKVIGPAELLETCEDIVKNQGLRDESSLETCIL